MLTARNVHGKHLTPPQGNYECAPGAMAAVIAKACALSGDTFTMNGFVLQRDKSRFGPAQQAYILLNAFSRFDSRGRVRKWVHVHVRKAWGVGRLSESTDLEWTRLGSPEPPPGDLVTYCWRSGTFAAVRSLVSISI